MKQFTKLMAMLLFTAATQNAVGLERQRSPVP